MMRAHRGSLTCVSAIGILLLQASAWAAEPVAVVTEVHPGKGEIRVKRAGENDWIGPQALMALRPGDQVRVSEDGRAVVVLMGGGAQTVTAANSPLAIQAPRVESGADRARGLLTGVTQFLLGQQKEPTYRSLSVRSAGAVPPKILSPRDTRLLPGPLTFEWGGSDTHRYRVRVFGPKGLEWEQSNLPRRPLEYPPSAPTLQPGTRYEWVLDVQDQPVQRTSFEILSPAEAGRVEGAVAELRAATVGAYPPSTVTVLQAGLLFQEGLYAAARRALQGGIAADPDEPTLHRLLAYVYDRIGLVELAAVEFDEADYLATRKP